MHWILLAVDLTKCTLQYLDPVENPCMATSPLVQGATKLVKYLLNLKFNKRLSSTLSSVISMQKDLSSCGVFVCLYAKHIAEETDLYSPGTTFAVFRKEIFPTIIGSCMKHIKADRNTCPLCNVDTLDDWVECTRCNQWLHRRCAGISKSVAA